MISSFDPHTATFLAGLQSIQSRAEKAQRELTTGLRINTVSDAPDQITNLLEMKARIAHNDQVTLNLGRVKTETDTAESALSSAVTVLERAQTLATQGASDIVTADTRQMLADQMGSVLENLVGIAATNIGGRYIFSGDEDQQAPYTIDLTQGTPVSPYAGSASTRQIESPDGTLISIGRTAQDIFDSNDVQNNVFAAVSNARLALQNNDSAGLSAAMAQMKSAGIYLNNQLAFFGMTQNRIASATADASDRDTSLHAELSGIEDADMAQSITDLTQAQTQQQAALSSEAALPRKTLFDYLG